MKNHREADDHESVIHMMQHWNTVDEDADADDEESLRR